MSDKVASDKDKAKQDQDIEQIRKIHDKQEQVQKDVVTETEASSKENLGEWVKAEGEDATVQNPAPPGSIEEEEISLKPGRGKGGARVDRETGVYGGFGRFVGGKFNLETASGLIPVETVGSEGHLANALNRYVKLQADLVTKGDARFLENVVIAELL